MSQLYQRRIINTDRTIRLLTAFSTYEISKNKNERIKGNVIATIQMRKSKL